MAALTFSAIVFAQPFSVKEGLFNQANTDTLDLDYPAGIETMTVFTPKETGDQFANGIVVISFKGKLYCQWQASAKDEDAPDTKVVYAVSEARLPLH